MSKSGTGISYPTEFSVFFSVTHLSGFFFPVTDDKAGNHTIHCVTGDPFPEKAVQVNTFLFGKKQMLKASNKIFNSSHFSFSSSQKIKFSLFLLLIGVGIASVTDLQLNFLGTVLSALAIVTTCVGQIVSFFIQLCLRHLFISKSATR